MSTSVCQIPLPISSPISLFYLLLSMLVVYYYYFFILIFLLCYSNYQPSFSVSFSYYFVLFICLWFILSLPYMLFLPLINFASIVYLLPKILKLFETIIKKLTSKITNENWVITFVHLIKTLSIFLSQSGILTWKLFDTISILLTQIRVCSQLIRISSFQYTSAPSLLSGYISLSYFHNLLMVLFLYWIGYLSILTACHSSPQNFIVYPCNEFYFLTAMIILIIQ